MVVLHNLNSLELYINLDYSYTVLKLQYLSFTDFIFHYSFDVYVCEKWYRKLTIIILII